jgi:hypothetical protein
MTQLLTIINTLKFIKWAVIILKNKTDNFFRKKVTLKKTVSQDISPLCYHQYLVSGFIP